MMPKNNVVFGLEGNGKIVAVACADQALEWRTKLP
jgi:hypothetical protein